GLFIKVCNAIQHAHQKGIVHRDIKPSNVLVTLHDGVPVPKVIDFGVAKATNTELTQKTLFTEHRQMVGTPAYMSPEQAEMSGLDIDTRTDIYSLGVLLYELLTGTTPFDSKELMSNGLAEMMRIIREQQPQKPSTRMTDLGETATTTADQRRADPRKLGTLLRGDLDWIVMKCLEKDRTRRYETANGLAADIDRHLCDEPVVAGPPSQAYRMRKFLHRNRVAVTVAALVFVSLVAVSSIAVAGFVHATRQQRVADAQRIEAELARAQAEAERERVETLREIITPSRVTLAVKPLENASGDPEQAYFANGITQAVIEELNRSDAIDVHSYSSVATLIEAGRTDEEITRDLGVELLLSGSVLRVGDQVQVRMSLDHPQEGLNLWTRTYTGSWSHNFDLQRRVFEDTVAEFNVQPSLEDDQRRARRDTTNAEARAYYWKGMQNLYSAGLVKSDRAIEFFGKAIALDEEYGLAHLGMANAYLFKSTLGVRPEEFNEQARAAALRAKALDDSMPGVYVVLGLVHLNYDWQWEKSRASLMKAIELDPFQPGAHAGLSTYYVSIGEFDLAREHLKKAVQIDPTSLLLHESIMYAPFLSRDMDLAIEICQDALDLDVEYWSAHAWMGLAMMWNGDMDEGIVHLEEARRLEPESPIPLTLLASAYGFKGRMNNDARLVALAKEQLEELKLWKDSHYICPYEIATVFLALGDQASAISFIQDAEVARSECIPFMAVDPRTDVIRDHPDIQAIMKRIDHPLFGKEIEGVERNAVRPGDLRRGRGG
ncbi:MAG: protein kinase domain-containing protein, partial [Planctomycetota bacterium]